MSTSSIPQLPPPPINWIHNHTRPSYNLKVIHQTIIGKALFEHALHPKTIAAVATSSSQIHNSSLGPNLLNLIQLDLSAAYIFSKTFLLSSSTTLQFAHSMYISAAGMDLFPEGEVIFNHLANMTKYFGRCLKKLTLYRPTPGLVKILNETLVSLETLNVVTITELLDSTNTSTVDLDAISSICKVPNLKHLDIRYDVEDDGGSFLHMRDEGLKIIGQSKMIRSLETLLFPGSNTIFTAGIQDLFASSDSFANLKKTSLRYCTGLFDDALKLLAEKCPNLTYLDLSHTNFTPEGIAHTAPILQHSLQYLDLNSCTRLLQSASFPSISSLTMLTDLNLSGGGSIQDSDIELLKDLQFLKRLILRECIELTDESIKHIVQSKFAAVLEELVLDECEFVSNEGMEYFIIKTDNQISGASSSTLPKLRVLSLDACYQVTDDGLKSIGDAFETLDSLTLNNLSGISDRGIVDGTCQMKDLKHISILFCFELTSASTDALWGKYTKISVEC